ncbi:hypothetical protein EBB07_26980 [Paenibacillaceae bacterium]|nr:hypothetical protein EBB07_26980 [Paenibacillaceae bacterium]
MKVAFTLGGDYNSFTVQLQYQRQQEVVIMTATAVHIHTVTGMLPPDKISHCQCHEHLFLAQAKPAQISPVLCIDDFGKTVQEIERYKLAGGSALVDAQPLGCGRMADALVDASLQTGLPIIASTGFHKLNFYWDNHWIHQYDEQRLTDIFVGELTEGMYINVDDSEPREQVAAKAGIIKTAVGPSGMVGSYVKCFAAAAEAAIRTGAPLQCHMEPNVDPLEIIRFFVERGVAPSSLYMCHLDRTHYDLALHEQVAHTGVYLEYDTIGRFKYHSDDSEAALIKHMIGKGYVRQLLLSLDTTRQRLHSYGGEIGLDYLLATFLPKLAAEGVSGDDIRQMTVWNPRKALAY